MNPVLLARIESIIQRNMLIETSLFQFHESIIKDSETLQCFK